MFVSREDFMDSIEILSAYEDISTEKDINPKILEVYAKEMFEDYESLMDDNKLQIIKMIEEDISIKLFTIN